MSETPKVQRAALTALAVIVCDQVSKELIRSSLTPGDDLSLVLGVKIVHTSNTGVAFGLFAGSSQIVMAALVAALALVLAWGVFSRVRDHLVWLPLGLVVGGAIGNLIDRIWHGSVTDFISFPHWPPFNVADSCVTVAMLLLVFLILREENVRSDS